MIISNSPSLYSAIKQLSISINNPFKNDNYIPVNHTKAELPGSPITDKPLNSRTSHPHSPPKELSTHNFPLDTYSAGDVYAESIIQPGNRDDANDLVPALLARMPAQNGILKGRALMVRRGKASTLYSAETPPGGQVLRKRRPPGKSVVSVALNELDKGDRMYRKIIAAAGNTKPAQISDTAVNSLRTQVATFISNNPELAEQENQALEQDSFFSMATDQAVSVYNSNLSPEDPDFPLTRRQSLDPSLPPPPSRRPWLQPLLFLLNDAAQVAYGVFGVVPLCGPAPDKRVKYTAVDIRTPTFIDTFHQHINDPLYLEKFVNALDQGLNEAKQRGLSEDSSAQFRAGNKLSATLDTILASGATISKEGCAQLLDMIQPFVECPDAESTDGDRVEPDTGAADDGPDNLYSRFKRSVNAFWSTLSPASSGTDAPVRETGGWNSTTNATVVTDSPEQEMKISSVNASRTVLNNPTLSFPPFNESNPNITVSRQSYEYSSLVLGIYQLRSDGLNDYERAVYFLPVLSSGANHTTKIDYNPVALSGIPSAGLINDLAKPDPTNPSETLALTLGNSQYRSSVWDRMIFPFMDLLLFSSWERMDYTHPTETAPSSISVINAVIDSCYRKVSEPGGYQLKKGTLTYEEVLTGECQDDKPLSTAALPTTPPAIQPSPVLTSSDSTLLQEAASQATSSRITEIINNQPALLGRVHLAILNTLKKGVYDTTYPELYLKVKSTIGFMKWNVTESETKSDLVNEFMTVYKQLANQLKKKVKQPCKDAPAKYLKPLQPAGGQNAMELSNKVWVVVSYDELSVLIPYPLKEVLTGVLVDYEATQLILLPQLAAFRNELVHPQFPELMHQALKYMAANDGHTVSQFFQRFNRFSALERRDRLSTINLPDDQQSHGYLTVLMSKVRADHPGKFDEPKLSDRVYVKSKRNNMFTLPFFRLKEILSGALAGYGPDNFILSGPLADHTALLAREDLADILHEGWQEYCRAPTIQTNQAPTRVLRQCMHFAPSLWDNPFMLSAINQIVDDAVEYHPEYSVMIAEPLAAKMGTGAYTDDQLQGYVLEFQEACTRAKINHVLRELERTMQSQQSPEELQDFLDLIQSERADLLGSQPPPVLTDRIWIKGKLNGLNVLVHYSVGDLLRGILAGADIEHTLAPPALEPWLPFLTNPGIPPAALYKTYKASLIWDVRAPIAEQLNRIAFPLTRLNAIVEQKARASGYPDLGMYTEIGTYVKTESVIPNARVVGPMDNRDSKVITQPYTLLNVIMNTQADTNAYNIVRHINLHKKYNTEAMKSLLRSLGEMNNWGADLVVYANDCLDTRVFKKGIRQLMQKNIEISPLPDNVQQFMLDFNYGDRHPFVVVLLEQRGLKHKVVGLYSYLTGERFTYTKGKYAELSGLNSFKGLSLSPDPFADELRTNPDEILQWMIANGGDSFVPAIMNGEISYDRLEGTSYWENRGIDYFIDHGPYKTVYGSSNMVRNLHTSYEEARELIKQKDIQQVIKLLKGTVGGVGMIPVLGDIIDVFGTYLLYELEKSGVTDTSQLQKLEGAQKRDVLFAVSFGFIPVVGTVTGRLIMNAGQALIDGTKAAIRTGKLVVRNADAIIRNLDLLIKKADGLTATNRMIDGQPNVKLDADGNPEPLRIETGSKAFESRCGVGKSRKKRAPAGPPLLCDMAKAPQELMDEVFKPDNIRFVTKTSGQAPVFHFSPRSDTTNIYAGSMSRSGVDVDGTGNIKYIHFNYYQKNRFFNTPENAKQFEKSVRDAIKNGNASPMEIEDLMIKSNGVYEAGPDTTNVKIVYSTRTNIKGSVCLDVKVTDGRVIATAKDLAVDKIVDSDHIVFSKLYDRLKGIQKGEGDLIGRPVGAPSAVGANKLTGNLGKPDIGITNLSLTEILPLYKKIFKPEYLQFVTHKMNHKPVLHFRHERIGGRISNEAINENGPPRYVDYGNSQKNLFFLARNDAEKFEKAVNIALSSGILSDDRLKKLIKQFNGASVASISNFHVEIKFQLSRGQLDYAKRRGEPLMQRCISAEISAGPVVASRRAGNLGHFTDEFPAIYARALEQGKDAIGKPMAGASGGQPVNLLQQIDKTDWTGDITFREMKESSNRKRPSSGQAGTGGVPKHRKLPSASEGRRPDPPVDSAEAVNYRFGNIGINPGFQGKPNPQGVPDINAPGGAVNPNIKIHMGLVLQQRIDTYVSDWNMFTSEIFTKTGMFSDKFSNSIRHLEKSLDVLVDMEKKAKKWANRTSMTKEKLARTLQQIEVQDETIKYYRFQLESLKDILSSSI